MGKSNCATADPFPNYTLALFNGITRLRPKSPHASDQLQYTHEYNRSKSPAVDGGKIVTNRKWDNLTSKDNERKWAVTVLNGQPRTVFKNSLDPPLQQQKNGNWSVSWLHVPWWRSIFSKGVGGVSLHLLVLVKPMRIHNKFRFQVNYKFWYTKVHFKIVAAGCTLARVTATRSLPSNHHNSNSPEAHLNSLWYWYAFYFSLNRQSVRTPPIFESIVCGSTSAEEIPDWLNEWIYGWMDLLLSHSDGDWCIIHNNTHFCTLPSSPLLFSLLLHIHRCALFIERQLWICTMDHKNWRANCEIFLG